MKKKIPPVLIILLSFLLTALIGSCLLMMPISLKNGVNLKYIDSLLLSISSLCVTGLTSIDISLTFTAFGKVIIALLIQIGGLGCISVASFLFIILGAKLKIGDSYLIKEEMNQDKSSNITKLLLGVISMTLSIEIIGSILNIIAFSKYYPINKAIGVGIFHTISAFNNCGLDIIKSDSMISFNNDIYLNVVTMILIILGGLGYIVIKDLIDHKANLKKCNVHTKIVLITSLSLIIVGMLSLKMSNSDMTWLQALFTSVNARTGGFVSYNLVNLTTISVLIMIFLMLIGASPCSTGGGIKTTTLYVMLASIFSFSRGDKTIVGNRKIAKESKVKAFTLFSVVIFTLFIANIIILGFENSNPIANLESVMFESVSAFSAVGITMGLTPSLTIGSKIVLSFLMIFGRLGPISILSLINKKWNRPNSNKIDYLEEKIIIG